MPRRYHRPPALKRRKVRRPGSPTSLEETASIENGLSTDVSSDAFAGEEWDDEAEVEDSVSTAFVAEANQGSSRDPVRHIQRDYGYVRSELTRIAAMAAIIVLGLAVVAIIR